MYDNKTLTPMLIGKEEAAFQDQDYIYEVKFDGVRCLAYIEKDHVEFRNKRNMKLNDKFPELQNVYQQVKKECVLDGELYVFKEGTVDFFEVQKRTLTSDKFKIRLAAHKYPATFTVFDCLYVNDKSLMEEPLMKRKNVLDTLIRENERINVSRYIETQGIRLFEETKKLQLEGIVAKKKDSLYHPGKRTKEWIKCKNLLEDDFVVCGYIPKEKGIVSLVLGQYRKKELVYKGHVTMGVAMQYLYETTKKSQKNPFPMEAGNDEAVWIEPKLVGIVKFMTYTANGGLRQPIFKGFRQDKSIDECCDHWYEEQLRMKDL